MYIQEQWDDDVMTFISDIYPDPQDVPSNHDNVNTQEDDTQDEIIM